MKKVPSIREAMKNTNKAAKFLLVIVLLSISFTALDVIFPKTNWIEWAELILDIIEWIAVVIYLIRLMKQIELTSAMAGALQEVIQDDYE